ncbi:response regulator [bacterium]|nr:response regulator [bacterium]
MALKILIVDDNDQVRMGLSVLLRNAPGIEVLGQSCNGREALDRVYYEKPDLVLMDVGMPVMDGIECCQRIKKMHPSVKVIMLTSHDSDEDVFAALAAGANGYCLKDADFDRLLNSIRSVAEGDCWLDSQIAVKIVSLSRSLLVKGDERGPFQPVSPREMEVLKLVVEGMNNRQIAETLNISVETVKTHIRHLMDKLAVCDRTQMAVKALRSGLI